MAKLFAIGVTNATVATVLAIMVWCVTRVWRQPPLAQLLWVLVLIKLVTPPLISIPWHFGRSSVESTTASDDASTRRSATTLSTEQVTANRPAASENLNDTIAPNIPALERVVSADGKEELYGVISPKIDAVARGPLDWIMLAVTAWLAGSVLWLLIAILRLARFNDALKNTVPCPDDVCSMAAEVAAKLGATGRFRLRLTDARLSPLVWPVGRPTIVLSRPLLGELSREETKTLLAHELAHLLRKDHWLAQ